MDEMLDFYRQIQERLVKEHHGQYVLIQDSKVLGFFDTFSSAYWAAVGDEKLEPGDFLVRLCQPKEDEAPATFYSRMA